MKLPNMIRIHQHFPDKTVPDIANEIKIKGKEINLKDKILVGDPVAVACSSQGIANYTEIVAAVVAQLKELGLKPFLIPAMGSHGSATGPGQKRKIE